MRKWCVALGMVFAGLTAGCSLFVPKTQEITLECSEKGARAVINGQVYTSPATVTINPKKDLYVECQKEGFESAARTIYPGLSTTGYLDAAGGACLILPAFGILSPGAWKIDGEIIHLHLEPRKGK